MRGLASFVGSSTNQHVTSFHARKNAARDDDADEGDAFAAHLQSAKSASKDADEKKDAADPATAVDPRALALAIPVDATPVKPKTELSLDAPLAGQMTNAAPDASLPALPIPGGDAAPADASKADEPAGALDTALPAAVEDGSASGAASLSPAPAPHGKGAPPAAPANATQPGQKNNVVRAGDLAAMSAAPTASPPSAPIAKPTTAHAASANGAASAQAAPFAANANAGGNSSSGGDRGANGGNGESKGTSNAKADALKADAAKSDAMKSELAAATTSLTDSVASEALTSAMRDNGLTTAKPLAQTANNAGAATSAEVATAAADSATTADRAAQAASAANQLVLRHATSGEIDHPELGRIAVNAELKDGHVDVRVSADRPESAAVLTPHAVHMASDVRAADIPLSRLHVDDGAASHASSGAFSSSSSGSENGTSRGSSRDGGDNGDRSGSSRGADTGVQTSGASSSGSSARVRIVL